MKVCVPVAQNCGLDSPVYGHFGSAPMFVLVDSETMSVESLANRHEVHAHGQCSPLKALAGAKPDAVIVGGIGAGALLGLRQAGIRVFQGAGKTVAEVVSLLRNGGLSEVDPEHACTGHGAGPGCHHSHG
jgi:predicted Fe-Mo cluster-binding NifX family protein